ncbi:hypothetical protein K1719_020588 [Acacia pycnantha]|nr:hypothetical protein K1719_020588 [Acacia pycnantha]
MLKNGLSCLVAISTSKRNKAKLVHLGAVKQLSKLLSQSKWSVSITENVLKLLETASTTKEGMLQICEDPNCVASILQKPGVRQMCADLLKIFWVNSKSCLSCYHTKTTYIMPF